MYKPFSKGSTKLSLEVLYLADSIPISEEILEGIFDETGYNRNNLSIRETNRLATLISKKGNFEFVDLEKGSRIKASAGEIRNSYNIVVKDWCEGVRRQCQEIGVEYLFCTTGMPLKDLLVSYLFKRTEVL